MGIYHYGAVVLVAMSIPLAACFKPGDTRDRVVLDRDADKIAIRKLLAANEAATNRHDSAGVVATYTSNGDVWIVGSPRLSGSEEIRRNEEEFYSTPGFQKWRTSIDSIRFIGRDAAIVETTDLTIMDDGDFAAQSTWIVSRHDGQWRFVAVRVMRFEHQP